MENNNLCQPILCIVLELCSKETLANLLSPDNIERRFNRIEALRIFEELVHGVAYIHEQKIVRKGIVLLKSSVDLLSIQIHRDLKPANIYFSIGGKRTVKIGDFGLVKEEGFNSLDTLKKSLRTGTQLYMSPEQDMSNNRSLITSKVDIYAMGIILFELLYPFRSVMERRKVLEDLRRSPVVFPMDMNYMLKTESLPVKKRFCCDQDPLN